MKDFKQHKFDRSKYIIFNFGGAGRRISQEEHDILGIVKDLDWVSLLENAKKNITSYDKFQINKIIKLKD